MGLELTSKIFPQLQHIYIWGQYFIVIKGLIIQQSFAFQLLILKYEMFKLEKQNFHSCLITRSGHYSFVVYFFI
jgi:hypothetical protein